MRLIALCLKPFPVCRRYGAMETDFKQKPVAVVVDDDDLVRFVVSDMLADGGFDVMEAADAAEALRIFQSDRQIVLLLTDIHMPGKYDGMELARIVHDQWPNVLLLLTSGQPGPASDDIPDDGRFLRKPYTERALLHEVSDLVAKKMSG